MSCGLLEHSWSLLTLKTMLQVEKDNCPKCAKYHSCARVLQSCPSALTVPECFHSHKTSNNHAAIESRNLMNDLQQRRFTKFTLISSISAHLNFIDTPSPSTSSTAATNRYCATQSAHDYKAMLKFPSLFHRSLSLFNCEKFHVHEHLPFVNSNKSKNSKKSQPKPTPAAVSFNHIQAQKYDRIGMRAI